MKLMYWLILIMFIAIPFCITADDSAAVPAEAVKVTESAVEVSAPLEAVESGPSFSKNLWVFMNSSLGISIFAFILTFILGKVFTAKPKWQALVYKYGPQLMQAVKEAEKRITIKSGGLSRLDSALGYIIKLEPKLSKVPKEELCKALTAVHTKAEASGNLKPAIKFEEI